MAIARAAARASREWARSAAAQVALLSGLLLAIGCAPDPPPAPKPLTVGVHEVELVVPPGWQHYDHGRQQRFEHGIEQISLTDLGPATPGGLQREITHARELFRRGQREDARAHLAGLRLRSAFPSVQRWESFMGPWRQIRSGGTADPEALEQAYTEVLAQVAALPTPDMATIAARALAELGHDERRDVASERAMAVDGRQALLVDTWDRLSHASRKRHVFILNEGNLLVARMELGTFAEMEPAFEALMASLHLPTGGPS